MKKFYYILLFNFIFYCTNIEASLSNKKIHYYEESKKLYQQIDPGTVSNKDADAYTILHRLRIRMYEYDSAIHTFYSAGYIKNIKDLCDQAVKITSTENPKIVEALQATLAYAKEIIPN